ncbi:hypothetical protein OF83DRAFT_1150226, partial [Amylostereum chailletii]
MRPSSRLNLPGFFLLSSVCVVGQNFAIPSTWQNTTSNLSRTDRAQIAQDTIGQLAPLIDSTAGTIDALSSPSTAASLFASFALNDWITGNTTYRSIVVSSIPTYLNLHPSFALPT